MLYNLLPVTDPGYRHISRQNGATEYFAGYDFMGGAEWTTDRTFAKAMPVSEAESVAADLAAADEPTMQDAIALMNKQYLPGIKKLLEKQDKCGQVTITINRAELRLIHALLEDHLAELRNEWYDATHEPLDPNEPLQTTAYWLSKTEERQRISSKLYSKLDRHYRFE